MPVAAALPVREEDRAVLRSWTRSSGLRAGLAQRARIVLLAAEGVSNTSIAELVGASRPTVIGWRERYQAKGIAGLEDEQRPGRPRTIDHRDRDRDPDAATEEAGYHALVDQAAGPPPAGLGCDGGQGLA